MGLETATYISDLNSSNPVHGVDDVSVGDDHIRLIKACLLATFPNFVGAAMTKTEAELNADPQSPTPLVIATPTTVNNSTTLVDITGLTGFTIEAGESYRLRALLFYDAGAGTADLKIGFSFSETPQSLFASMEAASASSDDADAIVTASDTLVTGLTPDAALQIEAFFTAHATNDGTLALQMAQNTAQALNTTISAGYAEIEKVS